MLIFGIFLFFPQNKIVTVALPFPFTIPTLILIASSLSGYRGIGALLPLRFMWRGGAWTAVNPRWDAWIREDLPWPRAYWSTQPGSWRRCSSTFLGSTPPGLTSAPSNEDPGDSELACRADRELDEIGREGKREEGKWAVLRQREDGDGKRASGEENDLLWDVATTSGILHSVSLLDSRGIVHRCVVLVKYCEVKCRG